MTHMGALLHKEALLAEYSMLCKGLHAKILSCGFLLLLLIPPLRSQEQEGLPLRQVIFAAAASSC